jgi:hypothetical protein
MGATNKVYAVSVEVYMALLVVIAFRGMELATTLAKKNTWHPLSPWYDRLESTRFAKVVPRMRTSRRRVMSQETQGM